MLNFINHLRYRGIQHPSTLVVPTDMIHVVLQLATKKRRRTSFLQIPLLLRLLPPLRKVHRY